MAGIRWPPEEPEIFPARGPVTTPAGTVGADLTSDDDRSVAADSWSIKSDYGSTLDDDQRHVDAAEVLAGCHYAAASEYSSDKDEQDANDVEPSMLGLRSYWDATYAEDLQNFHEHGHAGEIWFGSGVMDTVASWTKKLCLSMFRVSAESGSTNNDLSSWNVLDIGTGNGLLLQELAKQGFSDLTGTDYSEAAIDLARNLAVRDGFPNISFLVDDILETKLDKKFQLVVDKGTFDAIGLHPDGPTKRIIYWDYVSNLIEPGGILVITSCNNTKDELVQEVEDFNRRRAASSKSDNGELHEPGVFRYLDHIRTYPTVIFGGVEGSRVATVAFQHR